MSIYNNEDITLNAFDDKAKDDIISELSDDMLLESIFEQIDDLKISDNIEQNDHLKVIDGRVQFLKMQSSDDEDFLSQLDDLYKDIYRKILERINSKLEQKITFDDDFIITNTKILYHFFILGYEKTLLSFFKNYIDGNKVDLVKALDEKVNKNIVLKQYKKVMRKPEDAIILAYTFEVINLILNLDMSSYTFIDITTSGKNKESYPDYLIRDMFIEDEDDPDNGLTEITLEDTLFEILVTRIKHNQEDYTNLVAKLQYDLSNHFPRKTTYNKG